MARSISLINHDGSFIDAVEGHGGDLVVAGEYIDAALNRHDLDFVHVGVGPWLTSNGVIGENGGPVMYSGPAAPLAGYAIRHVEIVARAPRGGNT